MTTPAYRNDPAWIAAWEQATVEVSARNPHMPTPPDDLADAHGGPPKCEWCWDTGFCGKCCGRYPEWCPNNCVDGTCRCAAGRARRTAYEESLKGAGLP